MYGSISYNSLSSAQELLSFTRCERPNGTFYGTSGQCRKGKETTPVPRRAKGQSLEGADLDYPKLKQRARDWIRENNLGSPDDVQPGHDETHVLVRDYLGKSGRALGALLGEPSEGGPTNFEEALVEAFETLSRNPKLDRKSLFPDSVVETFSLSRNLGVLPKEHLFNRNAQRAVDVTVRYLDKISQRPDFNLFLQTVKAARKAALKEYRDS
jgi:hypothetical protein